MPSLTDMKKKSVIIGAIIGTTIALFLLVTAVAVPSVNAFNSRNYFTLKLYHRISQAISSSELRCS
jgi:hypothetical protein